MADMIQFDRNRSSRPDCLHMQDLLADAVDGLLSEPEQAAFDRHIAGCDACAPLLAEAQRGAAWLAMLKTPRPEPSAQLLERILAQTTGPQIASDPTSVDLAAQLPLRPESQPQRLPATVQPAAYPEAWPARVLPFRPRPQQPVWPEWKRVNRFLLEPRLAMTAAMAFFSIALTLNLAGVRVDQLHARDLKPANLRRSYYEASASAVRRYDNLRVVHVLESRVDDLREASQADREPSGAPAAVPESRRDQPVFAGPQAAGPTDVRPKAAEPKDAGPSSSQPSDQQPRQADPKAADPKAAGPGMSRQQPILLLPSPIPVASMEGFATFSPAYGRSTHPGGLA